LGDLSVAVILATKIIYVLHKQEHILESQDREEVDRVKANVEQCRKTLQSLGYADFTFEDFFAVSILIFFFLPINM
jgi:hypothetical protein